MKQRNITEEDVTTTMDKASGRYASFKMTPAANGAERFGYWHDGRLIVTEVNAQGDRIVVNVMSKSRQVADTLIKAAGGP